MGVVKRLLDRRVQCSQEYKSQEECDKIISTVPDQVEDKLRPDRGQAELYLHILDPSENEHVFTAFHDSDRNKARSLPYQLVGTLSLHWERMVGLNRLGYGIFVTVNRTNLRGRKKKDITGIRAFWRENDTPGLPDLPIKPNMVVATSPGKKHEYILVKDAPLDKFESVQQRLVDDWGSDPNAKDRSRVLRLPGFFHQKVPTKPYLVHLVQDGAVMMEVE